jgi:hydroxypyruvate isomerase
MEGDVIRTIRERRIRSRLPHRGYPAATRSTAARSSTNHAICRAIVEAGYTGFLAQEFVPTDEPLRALEEAFRICDV